MQVQREPRVLDPLGPIPRDQVLRLAARYGLPTSYPWREFTIEGGLMNYGALIREQFHEVGTYAARILRREKPAECRYSGPPALARALGIEVPPTATSDEVIA
jgi:putative tryptophan/tyrosine transport system substrate-binding protein